MLGYHQHTSEMSFKWRFVGGSMMTRLEWYLDPTSPYQLLKNVPKLDPIWQNFLDPRMQILRTFTIPLKYFIFYSAIKQGQYKHQGP